MNDTTEPTVAELRGLPAGTMPDPDLTDLPPRRLLPKSLHKLYAQREAAWERYVDFESEHHELLSLSWEKTFARRDETAGGRAVADGVDPLSVPSALAEAKSRRPRVVGALKALVAEVNKADQALCAAVRRELGLIGESVEAEVSKAADAYVELQRAADEARQVYGARLRGREWWIEWAKLGVRSHYSDVEAATPLTVHGGEVRSDFGYPVRGAAEVRAINDSYGAVHYEPTVEIRAKNSGQLMTIKQSHAAALVRNGSAEYTDSVPQ